MAFVKDMLRMWAHSWKRFISIAMITLLGVAVLTGIYAGCRDAFRSTDRFFDAQGLHDVQVLSTAGLSNGDIAALRKVNGVAKVQAERSQEVTFDLDGRKSATMQEIGTNGIDQPYLQEGRMPKKAGEIAVTRKFIRDSGKRIGSRLTVTPESASSDTSDTNDTNGADGTNETNGTDEAPSFPTKLTIVGVVLDPQNLSNPDGYSAIFFFVSSSSEIFTIVFSVSLVDDLPIWWRNGRRARFRCVCREACRFESCSGHYTRGFRFWRNGGIGRRATLRGW